MKQLFLKSVKYLFVLLVFMLVSNSCDKAIDSQVPNIPFRVELNLINSRMESVGTYFLPGLGFGGTIVFCAWPSEEYYAFDATCTHEISSNYPVLKDEKIDDKLCPCQLSSFVLTCPGCGSQFNVGDGAGYPIKGPAIAPLKQYRTSLNNSTLIIYNY